MKKIIIIMMCFSIVFMMTGCDFEEIKQDIKPILKEAQVAIEELKADGKIQEVVDKAKELSENELVKEAIDKAMEIEEVKEVKETVENVVEIVDIVSDIATSDESE